LSVYATEMDEAPERLLYKIDENSMRSYDFLITKEDICTRLAKLKIDKSPGPDQLHPRILYEIRDVIAYPLFLIFSKSIETGYPVIGNSPRLQQYIRKAQNTIEVITSQLV